MQKNKLFILEDRHLGDHLLYSVVLHVGPDPYVSEWTREVKKDCVEWKDTTMFSFRKAIFMKLLNIKKIKGAKFTHIRRKVS